jgi:hypothetical protein
MPDFCTPSDFDALTLLREELKTLASYTQQLAKTQPDQSSLTAQVLRGLHHRCIVAIHRSRGAHLGKTCVECFHFQDGDEGTLASELGIAADTENCRRPYCGCFDSPREDEELCGCEAACTDFTDGEDDI